MTQEIIEKEIDARLDEPDNNFGGIFNNGYSQGFRNGARWRIDSVWHDAREMPKLREHIVVKTKQGDFTSWFVTPDIMQVFDKFNVELWARSSDLLPEGKEA